MNAVIGPWISWCATWDRRPAEPLLLLSRVGQYNCPRKSEAASEGEWACEPRVRFGSKADPPLMAGLGRMQGFRPANPNHSAIGFFLARIDESASLVAGDRIESDIIVVASRCEWSYACAAMVGKQK